MTFLCLMGLLLSTLVAGGGLLGISAVSRSVTETRLQHLFRGGLGMSNSQIRRRLRLDLKFYKEIAWVVGGVIGIILSLLPCAGLLPR